MPRSPPWRSSAGVNISSLYRRFASKEELIRQLCSDGLRSYIEIAEAAIDDEAGEPWEVFATFMRRIMEADNHALTVRLAGRFVPNAQNGRDAARAFALNEQLVVRDEGRRSPPRGHRRQRPHVRVRTALLPEHPHTAAHGPAAIPLPDAAPRCVAGTRAHAPARTAADGQGSGGPLAGASPEAIREPGMRRADDRSGDLGVFSASCCRRRTRPVRSLRP